MSGLWAPFEFEFFRQGFAMAVLAGALCGLIGTFVVLRHMSYLGHGLSHAVFGGAAVGSVMGIGYYLAAGTWGLAAALLIGRASRRRVLHADAMIAVVTAASFAAGVAALSRWGQARRGIEAVLFGAILGVQPHDLIVVTTILIVTAVVLAVAYRPLLFAAFDPEAARSCGTRVDRLDDLLMVMLALAVLATMQVVGAVLVSATLVMPAASVRLVTNRFGPMLIASTILGAATGAVGMIASYHLDVPSGAAMTLVAAIGFVVAWSSAVIRGRV